MELQRLKDKLAIEACGETTAQAYAKGLCINCKQPALERCYSAAGRKEYAISGMCERCFDSIFEEE